VTSDQVDVGIYTHPAHRRKGLAAAVVAATAEHCLSHGFRQVGWHCNAENVASWKTAERAGFYRNREYVYYWYAYDRVDHWLELGRYLLRRAIMPGRPSTMSRPLRRAPSTRSTTIARRPWPGLTWRADRALTALNAAVDHGSGHAEWTRQQPAFRLLHGLPEWERVLVRMAQAAQR